jgi:hypothetical protein
VAPGATGEQAFLLAAPRRTKQSAIVKIDVPPSSGNIARWRPAGLAGHLLNRTIAVASTFHLSESPAQIQLCGLS